MNAVTSPRVEELIANRVEVEARVTAACTAAGRERSEITVITVTKTFPASDVRLLSSIGTTDVGENRDQEAAAKAVDCADLPLRWHFVGQLQRNKCRSVATYADVVHSVDSVRLAQALGGAATRAQRDLTALIQVGLDRSATGSATGRGGASGDEVMAIAAAIDAAPGLVLGGVMAVAPLGADADDAFAELGRSAATLRVAYPAATTISAGMSGDLEAAIRHGATHLRVGTALLGRRGAPVG